MLKTEAMKLLVRKHPLHDEEWYSLIEFRASLIKPCLGSFSFPALGEFSGLRTGARYTHELRVDNPAVTGDKRFSLKTQGIFGCSQAGIHRMPDSGYRACYHGDVSCPDGVMYFWGFVRGGLWILVEVVFKGEKGHAGNGYERAEVARIQELSLAAVIAQSGATPKETWEGLGIAIRDRVKFHKQRYREALEIAQQIEMEELALSLVSAAGSE